MLRCLTRPLATTPNSLLETAPGADMTTDVAKSWAVQVPLDCTRVPTMASTADGVFVFAEHPKRANRRPDVALTALRFAKVVGYEA